MFISVHAIVVNSVCYGTHASPLLRVIVMDKSCRVVPAGFGSPCDSFDVTLFMNCIRSISEHVYVQARLLYSHD